VILPTVVSVLFATSSVFYHWFKHRVENVRENRPLFEDRSKATTYTSRSATRSHTAEMDTVSS
jgi:hypothetical protein